MRSLFFRLFFSFLLAMVVAGILSGLVFFAVGKVYFESFRADISREQEENIARFIVISGQAARDIYRSSGLEAYRTYIKAYEAATGTRLFLVAEKDDNLALPAEHAALQELVAAARNAEGLQVSGTDRQVFVARRLAGAAGEMLVTVGIHRKGPPHKMSGPPPGLAGPPPVGLGGGPGLPGPPPGLNFASLARADGLIRLAILVLVAGGVCLLLARSFVQPVRKLRRVTRQIAAGDFSARVGDSLGRVDHEIVQLSRDFDSMAAATEKVILSRQRLLRDISHELRSPLARLNVALELLRQRDYGRNDGSLATIEKESARLNELIGDLLSLTRLEDGQGEQKKEAIDLWRMVLEIVGDANFEVASTDRGIKVTSLEDIRIEGSPELVRRAIENVVRNAARYTARDTEAEIALGQSGGMAVIRVSDRGPGVPEEELDALFRPFYRVATARDRQSGGTGLGLAIAAQAVKWHGGSIEAANDPNGGLVVTLSLPLSQLAPLPERTGKKGSSSGQSAG